MKNMVLGKYIIYNSKRILNIIFENDKNKYQKYYLKINLIYIINFKQTNIINQKN